MLLLFVIVLFFFRRACDRSRLRLAAACGFIKLAKSSTVRDFIPIPMIQTLVLTVQVLLHMVPAPQFFEAHCTSSALESKVCR